MRHIFEILIFKRNLTIRKTTLKKETLEMKCNVKIQILLYKKIYYDNNNYTAQDYMLHAIHFFREKKFSLKETKIEDYWYSTVFIRYWQ